MTATASPMLARIQAQCQKNRGQKQLDQRAAAKSCMCCGRPCEAECFAADGSGPRCIGCEETRMQEHIATARAEERSKHRGK